MTTTTDRDDENVRVLIAKRAQWQKEKLDRWMQNHPTGFFTSDEEVRRWFTRENLTIYYSPGPSNLPAMFRFEGEEMPQHDWQYTAMADYVIEHGLYREEGVRL